MVVCVAECDVRDDAAEELTVVRPGRERKVSHRLCDLGIIVLLTINGAQRRHCADVADPASVVCAVESAQDQHAARGRGGAAGTQAMTSHRSLPCGNFAIASEPSSRCTETFGLAPPSSVVPVSGNCLTARFGSSSDETSSEERSSSAREMSRGTVAGFPRNASPPGSGYRYQISRVVEERGGDLAALPGEVCLAHQPRTVRLVLENLDRGHRARARRTR